MLTMYPRIKNDYTWLLELRGSLVHGNLQEMREIINATLPKSKQEKHKGHAIMVKLETGAITHLSEKNTSPEDIGPFGWLLEVINSEIFFTAISLFEESFHNIGLLAQIKSMSFDQASGVFDRIFKDGSDLDQEIQKLKEHRHIHFNFDKNKIQKTLRT